MKKRLLVLLTVLLVLAAFSDSVAAGLWHQYGLSILGTTLLGAAAFWQDGRLAFASAEERLSRCKGDRRCPVTALDAEKTPDGEALLRNFLSLPAGSREKRRIK